MPLKGNPVCLKCEASESPLWTNAENLGAICLNCINETKDNIKEELEEEEEQGEPKPSRRKTRTTRCYKTRLNPFAVPKLALPKGKGRRTKSTPMKAPVGVATPVTSDYVFYKGTYMQVGDIVSMLDENSDTYYAQIRGFLTDQYCEKSAVVTWLLPTRFSPSPKRAFDPATYVIGPEEDVPRKLDCMEFIMHAPSDYYKSKTTPYPSLRPTGDPGYIWTTLKPVQRQLPQDSTN